MSTAWDPAAYLAFDDHRARPFHDLLARITARAPRRVVDLGCGPGNLTVLLPARWPGAVVEALEYASSLSDDVRAIYVDVDPAGTEQIKKQWELWGRGIRLVILDSPYRSLMEPLLEYIEQVDAEAPDDYVTIVLPEFVPARWWHHLLHNQRALLIKAALLFKPNTVVTSVPFHLSR